MSLSPRRALFVWLCLILAASLPAQAQEKIRIAVWDVENNAATSWAFWNDMGPAARNHIDTEFSENPTLAAKFAVVERTQLALVMKEQGLAASGAVTPQTAARVGSLLGVKYIVVGGIDKFAINDTKAGFRGVGGNLQQAEATINLRFIDTTTGERVLAVSGEAEVQEGRRLLPRRVGQPGRAVGHRQRSDRKSLEDDAGKVRGRRLPRAAARRWRGPAPLKRGSSRSTVRRVWINVGAPAGLKVGDTFGVFNVGEALIDPVTGASLGADEKQTGSAAVIEVQDKYAVVTLTGTATAKDVLRKAP